jgi:protein-disulfide isomerase
MKHFLKTTLALTLASVVVSAQAQPNNNISPAERAKVESIVHDYLVNKPEVLVEAIQGMQRKQYEQAEKTIKNTQQTVSKFAPALFHQTADPVAGNPSGKVTIVEFFDYQCPHCVDMAPVISSIIKNNPDVRVVFKEFPIRGPVSDFASRAALAANLQGKYYDFSHAVLTAPQPLTSDAILAIAKAQGLDVDKLKKDMDDKAVAEQLKNNTKLAQDLKLFGTPAFFIGKTDGSTITYVPGQMDATQLQGAIDKAK